MVVDIDFRRWIPHTPIVDQFSDLLQSLYASPKVWRNNEMLKFMFLNRHVKIDFKIF